MFHGGATFSVGAAGCKKIKLLGLCITGAEELIRAFQTALQPAPNVEILKENLPTAVSLGSSQNLRGPWAKDQPDLVVLFIPSGKMEEIETVFDALETNRRGTAILAILETATPSQLQQLINLGTADFCLAPLRSEDLLPRILRWSSSLSKENRVAQELEKNLGLKRFLGESRVFLEAIRKIPKLARCDASVLITGETGTGKEMCARAIHHLSPRADHPFVPVNCGAIPSELVENELFGHDAGAFTSASSAVRGLVHEAEGGTLFLDEVDSLPLPVQVKFLRFLQDQEYRPLGARKTLQADVRIVAASNAPLGEVIRSNRFRLDLFYRLNVLPLTLPALRERREDIPLLARHFVAKYAREYLDPD